MATMRLLDLRGGYLYQHRPDIIPQGFVTSEELSIWSAYYEIRTQEQKQRGKHG